MRICFAVLYYTPRLVSADAAEYLSRVPIHREIPRRLAGRGHRVDVVHAYPYDMEHSAGGVRYHFVGAGRLARAAGSLGARLLGRGRADFEIARRAVARVADLEPDVVHFAGVTLHLNLELLLRRLRRDAALVLHHHGGELSKRWWTRRLQLRGVRRAARLLVSSRDHAESFVRSGAIDAGRVVEFMESSSPFQWRSRAEARRETGMDGDPVFLSAGRLHPVKDPFVMLAAFEQIAREWTGARLYLCYLTDELLGEMRAWVRERPALDGRVEFLGRLAPPEMEAAMNSADFLLQASRREWSGIAVLDAMACGVIPVVTDIPAFRAMTGCGHALLFPVGDAGAMARRVLSLGREEIPERAAAVRRHFNEHLSFARLAERLEEVFRDLAPIRNHA